MIVAVREWYATRAAREQRLIIAMLAIALPVLAWLLFVLPLSAAYDKALERHLQSVDRNGRVRALAASSGTAKSVGAPDGDLGRIVTDTAGRNGLTLDSTGPAGVDAVAVTIAQAPPIVVTQWLSGLEEQGFRLDDLRIAPAGPGGVSVSLKVIRARA